MKRSLRIFPPPERVRTMGHTKGPKALSKFEGRVAKLLATLHDYGRVLGAQVAVWHKGRIICDTAVGQRGPIDLRPVTPSTLFSAMGISNALATTALLWCIDRKLPCFPKGVDTPVNHKFLWPDFDSRERRKRREKRAAKRQRREKALERAEAAEERAKRGESPLTPESPPMPVPKITISESRQRMPPPAPLGGIALDDEIPLTGDEEERDEEEDEATVRDILRHTSGMHRMLPADLRLPQMLSFKKMCAHLEKAADYRVRGEVCQYAWSTFSYLVSEIVERASGKPLWQLFKEELAEPLGLENSLMVERVSTKYTHDELIAKERELFEKFVQADNMHNQIGQEKGDEGADVQNMASALRPVNISSVSKEQMIKQMKKQQQKAQKAKRQMEKEKQRRAKEAERAAKLKKYGATAAGDDDDVTDDDTDAEEVTSGLKLLLEKPHILDPLAFDCRNIYTRQMALGGRVTASALCLFMANLWEQNLISRGILEEATKPQSEDPSLESLVLTGGSSRVFGLGFQLFKCEELLLPTPPELAAKRGNRKVSDPQKWQCPEEHQRFYREMSKKTTEVVQFDVEAEEEEGQPELSESSLLPPPPIEASCPEKPPLSVKGAVNQIADILDDALGPVFVNRAATSSLHSQESALTPSIKSRRASQELPPPRPSPAPPTAAPDEGPEVWGFGHGDMNGSVVISFPSHDLVVSVMLNALNTGPATSRELLEYILPQFGIQPNWYGNRFPTSFSPISFLRKAEREREKERKNRQVSSRPQSKSCSARRKRREPNSLRNDHSGVMPNALCEVFSSVVQMASKELAEAEDIAVEREEKAVRRHRKKLQKEQEEAEAEEEDRKAEEEAMRKKAEKKKSGFFRSDTGRTNRD
mmetsp:Transcript_41540/g.81929  ORF Transcript_41540/g.81929 Transcript_41540/m.81929 type:complete len:875 (+) Transcript_41540:1547-4171(+)